MKSPKPLLYYGGIFDWDKSVAHLSDLNAKTEDPQFWDTPEAAQKIIRERDHLSLAMTKVTKLERELSDAITLIELGDSEDDAAVIIEGEEALQELAKRTDRLRLETLLSGEVDANDCFLEIHAGAGGTEAQDWALMIQRLYLRWAERNGYKIEWMDEISGEEAGIKSCTFKVIGHQAYGWLKTESGVHRLVRISPFDSNSRRHTSFASVWVYPVIDDSFDVEIEEKDLRIDTYRASGAGGQHVNKTESAIRITHIPTNIVVQCQNDRSQHRNRAQAFAMLKARLYEFEMQKREAATQAQNASKSDIGWGHQIRSYVLHPYQLVKDLRTDVETGNTQAVLDGDIDLFIEAALAAKLVK